MNRIENALFAIFLRTQIESFIARAVHTMHTNERIPAGIRNLPNAMESKPAVFVYGTIVGLVCAYAAWLLLESSETGNSSSTRSAGGEEIAKPAIIRRSLTVKKDFNVEICLSDIRSLRNAIAGGCNSIELCVDRPGGGKYDLTI